MTTSLHTAVSLRRGQINRRSFLYSVPAMAFAAGSLSLRDVVTLQAADLKKQGMHMVLLWMGGGPSQFESWDPKPGHENGGPTKAISTAVPGIQVAEGWGETAKVMNDIALIRSMTNKEGSHPRASYQLHTGYAPAGSVKHPAFGAALAKELWNPAADLPAVVSIGPTQGGDLLGQGAGFLGVNFEPFSVVNPQSMPENVTTQVPTDRYRRRLGLLDQLEEEFSDRGAAAVVKNHRDLYGKTSRLVLSTDLKAFDTSSEPAALAAKYGTSTFGRGCLLARRLIESGVTFVEVQGAAQGGNWDTHQDNAERTATLARQIDPGFAALIADLKDRRLLERTVVLWIGEFGRTPRINPRGGRDHYPRVFSAAIAGAGIQGGQVIGASTKDGSAVEADPVTPNDLFASICQRLGVNAAKENMSPLGRPMKIVDGGKPVEKLVGKA